MPLLLFDLRREKLQAFTHIAEIDQMSWIRRHLLFVVIFHRIDTVGCFISVTVPVFDHLFLIVIVVVSILGLLVCGLSSLLL